MNTSRYKICFNDVTTGEKVEAFVWTRSPEMGLDRCRKEASTFGYVIDGEPWYEEIKEESFE